LSGTFSNLIREVFSYWFVRALLYPKMTPRTYNLFIVVVFKRRARERVRSEQEEDKEEAFWKMDGALYTTAGWRKREKKRNLSRRNPPRTGLSRMAPRAEKRETHISRNVLCDCTVLYPSHRSPSLFSLSLTPTKTSRSRIKNLIIIKTNSEENDATRNEKHHRISPKTKDIINHRVMYSYLQGCLLSFGIFLVMCIMR